MSVLVIVGCCQRVQDTKKDKYDNLLEKSTSEWTDAVKKDTAYRIHMVDSLENVIKSFPRGKSRLTIEQGRTWGKYISYKFIHKVEIIDSLYNETYVTMELLDSLEDVIQSNQNRIDSLRARAHEMRDSIMQSRGK